ncbi:hypothetical protein HUT19_35640 [Streptomyces sp. NA02950]|uniref:hypothetical protein n=1 Tax=Streptomyces sp. NA02950 TaxID=2742137 RepID=UPI001590E787|nr:hypothetical protein [Streptomyces sp. NA02950]QKV96384.1 hypothetical protein HUT19_35640 [Streptomyces sp. NA02950]
MSSRSPGVRDGEPPRQVENAFLHSLGAIALQLVSWVLDAFVFAPTGLGETRYEVGRRVVSALWLFLAVRMRAGRNWARTVLTAATALSALFLLNSLSMSGYPWDGRTGGQQGGSRIGAGALPGSRGRKGLPGTSRVCV